MGKVNRGPEVEAVAILFLTLTWVFVSLRCYVRAVMIKNFGTDDWLAVLALILFSLYCTFVLLGVKYGTGRHLANIPPADVPTALKWWWLCELTYVSSTAVVKASICIFLNRICVRRSEKIVIWAVMVAVIVFSIFYFFLIMFQCHPVVYFWTQYLGDSGGCVSSSVIANSSYAHSAVSVAADWTLGILPIFLVWNLVMSPRIKVSVALILALGAIGSTATIVRIPYISQLTQDDFLYSTTDLSIWSTVEPGIGITASAMATLRPLFQSFLARSRLFGGSTGTQEASGSHGWRNFNGPARAGYFRSGGNARVGDAAEFGLSDVRNGVGVTTVIQSTNDGPSGKGTSKSSGTSSRNRGVDPLQDDSSEEFLPMQNPKGEWEVRKTTEVMTTQERDINE
ncbi:hypothetical protein LHYA1_G002267 [Lachnellula hyalina]|uniref:Rhodopsin domain-containing protein n=1 Tax=Lachnellula hyalina TaxID=1316788 RepID=A0A8H8R5X7_9HELO|nr:uncharacterized protein LHYA1_G002267 [Lachnellula hyalina]TVY29039.1 hypothetical protein LHYA1_G002267 [Lachnellula hyalina]